MSSALSGLYQANAQRKIYKAQAQIADKQAELTRVVGTAQKNKAYAEATTTEETARRNAALAAQQQRQMRKNQQAAAGAAETAAASSGFDVGSGSGRAARESTIEQFDEYIGNMAQSNSISSINALQRAIDFRRDGDMQERMANIDALGYEGEAAAYRAQAKAMKRGMLTGAVGSLVGGVAGGIFGGFMGAEQGASMGWNLGASFNPYTASYTNGSGLGNLMSIFSGSSGSTAGWGGSGWGATSGYTQTYDGGWMDQGGYTGLRRY